jgi:hypothetical protein
MAEKEEPIIIEHGRKPAQIVSLSDLARWNALIHLYPFWGGGEQFVNLLHKTQPTKTEAVPDEVEIVERALEVIGSPQRLSAWMATSIPALGGSTPYSLLSTDEGRKRVSIILGRIEHGVY